MSRSTAAELGRRDVVGRKWLPGQRSGARRRPLDLLRPGGVTVCNGNIERAIILEDRKKIDVVGLGAEGVSLVVPWRCRNGS